MTWTRSYEWIRPWNENRSPVQALRSTSIASTVRTTRSDRGWPNIRNSSSRHASPRPRISRPPEIWSTTAASSASRSGSWKGVRTTPVPSRIRDVAAANAASIGSSEGRYPSPAPWCSLTQAESKPTVSARRTRSSVSRYSCSNVRFESGGTWPVNSPIPM